MKLKTRIAKLEAHIQPTQKPTPDLSCLTDDELEFLIKHISEGEQTKEEAQTKFDTLLKKAGLHIN